MKLDRLKEASSWAGMGAIAAALAPIAESIDPRISWGLSVFAMIFGGVAVKVHEYPNKK